MRCEAGNRGIGAFGLLKRLGCFAPQYWRIGDVIQGRKTQRNRLGRIAACENLRDQADPSP